ncbi:MAG: hypothetical protein WCT08_03395 [Patescibacteria group bacterium]|jgi:hypothetical protein
MKNPTGFLPIAAIIIIVVVAAVVAGGSYYYTKSLNKNTNTVVNTNVAMVNENTNAVVNTNTTVVNGNTNVTVNSNGNLNTNTVIVNSNTNTVVNSNTNSDATAGWKTYTNAKQGYSVKYPSNWVTQVQNTNGGEVANGNITTFWSKPNYKDLIPEGTEWVPTDTLYYFRVHYQDESSAANAVDPNTKKLSSEAITVGGISGLKEAYQGAYGKWTVVYVTKNGIKYGLYLPDKTAEQQAHASTILSTFTFLDQTVGWKTYTNTEYGFSFKYPASWKETDYTASADSPLNSDGVKFEDSAGKAGSFYWMQGGYVPTQDGQWDSTTTSLTVGGRTASQVRMTPKAGQQWAGGEPKPRAVVSLTSNPTTWGSNASMGLVQGSEKSWVTVDTILSTFTFTK